MPSTIRSPPSGCAARQLRPGQFVQVDFHGEQTADSVVLETAPNQWAARFELEGQDAAGRWHLLAGAPVAATLRARWAWAAPWRTNSSAGASITCWSSTPITALTTCD